MRKQRYGQWLGIGVVVLACLVAADIVRVTMRDWPDSVEELKANIPAEVLDSSTGAVRLTGRDLEKYHRLTPLLVGRPAPRIRAADYRQNHVFRIPAADGRPTICVVSCGCTGCSPSLHHLVELRQKLGPTFQAIGIVANNSEYSWGHHASGFQFKEPLRLVWDKDGKLMRRLRPPGSDPTRLPLVWACDGDGVVRFVTQPDPGRVDWSRKALADLHLPIPPGL